MKLFFFHEIVLYLMHGALHDNYLMKKGQQIWALVGPDPRIWAMPES